MHISKCATGGVAFGGFSTSAEGKPKAEFFDPVYLYGGIAQIGDGSGSILPQLGVQTGVVEPRTISTGKIAEVAVTFARAYASPPIVVAGLKTTSDAYEHARCACAVDAVTKTGFTMRLYNHTGAGSEPVGASWIAVGV